MSIWDPRNETMPREDLLQLQLERLQATVHRAYRSVSFYRRLFDEAGVDPDGCRSLEDVRRLPFTTRAHVADHHPYGLFAVPLREVVRLHATTGAEGRPAVTGYTGSDIRRWGECVARVLAAAGVTKDDVVQIAFDYGFFPDGFGFHHGAERLGASVIPTSGARIARQVEIMRDYRSTVLISPPSVALEIADYVVSSGLDPAGFFLRAGIFSAEPWSEDFRSDLEERLRIKAFDAYTLGEVMGPGVAGECAERSGMHLQEDHLLAEVVDPGSGRSLPEGEEGELVLTTLTREAFPLVRYRTGDITRRIAAPCPCGRTSCRLARIGARTDDMVSVRGVHFYPAQIGGILASVEGMEPRFELALQRDGGQDLLEIRVEVSERIFFDEMRRQRLLIDEAERRIQEEIRLPTRVKLVEPRSLGQAPGPARLVDERRR